MFLSSSKACVFKAHGLTLLMLWETFPFGQHSVELVPSYTRSSYLHIYRYSKSNTPRVWTLNSFSCLNKTYKDQSECLDWRLFKCITNVQTCHPKVGSHISFTIVHIWILHLTTCCVRLGVNGSRVSNEQCWGLHIISNVHHVIRFFFFITLIFELLNSCYFN